MPVSSIPWLIVQGLKRLQDEITTFENQKAQELERLQKFKEEELQKLRYVSVKPGTQFSKLAKPVRIILYVTLVHFLSICVLSIVQTGFAIRSNLFW